MPGRAGGGWPLPGPNSPEEGDLPVPRDARIGRTDGRCPPGSQPAGRPVGRPPLSLGRAARAPAAVPPCGWRRGRAARSRAKFARWGPAGPRGLAQPPGPLNAKLGARCARGCAPRVEAWGCVAVSLVFFWMCCPLVCSVHTVGAREYVGCATCPSWC